MATTWLRGTSGRATSSHTTGGGAARLATRELGDWIEVEVDGVKKRVTCNCEDYNFHYICFHQVTFELLQFSNLPDEKCSRSTENWTVIRNRVLEYLKKMYLGG